MSDIALACILIALSGLGIGYLIHIIQIKELNERINKIEDEGE